MLDNIFPVSVAKFAAYLDGNLSADEMVKVSSLICSDPSMRDIMEASEEIDNTIEHYTPEDISVFNDTIECTPFSIPDLESPISNAMADFLSTEEADVFAYSDSDSESTGSIAYGDDNDNKSYHTFESDFDDMHTNIANQGIYHDEYQYGDQHEDNRFDCDRTDNALEDLNDDINQY